MEATRSEEEEWRRRASRTTSACADEVLSPQRRDTPAAVAASPPRIGRRDWRGVGEGEQGNEMGERRKRPDALRGR